jgi:hypothetical protein
MTRCLSNRTTTVRQPRFSFTGRSAASTNTIENSGSQPFSKAALKHNFSHRCDGVEVHAGSRELIVASAQTRELQRSIRANQLLVMLHRFAQALLCVLQVLVVVKPEAHERLVSLLETTSSSCFFGRELAYRRVIGGRDNQHEISWGGIERAAPPRKPWLGD